MARFKYTGKDANGNLKKGVIEALDKGEAADLLSQNKVTPIVITQDKDILSMFKNISLFDHISLSDKLMFCEELATLVNAGVPLTQSITIIKEQAVKGTMRKVTANILREIEGGKSLSGALETESKHFSPVFINMIKMGETSGTLDKTLNDLAVQTEKDHELVGKIKSAMTYPAVIIVGMIGAVIFLMVKVIPSISQLFDELDVKLPWTTKLLISISKFMLAYGIWVAIGSVLVVIGIRTAFKRVEGLRRGLHIVIIKTPVIGGIALKFNIARFARTLGALLASGVTVLEALDIVSRSTKNMIFSEEVKEIAEKVKNGAAVAEPMKQSKIFPIMIAQMAEVGEETGTLDKMLIKVAEFYERQIDNFTKNISSIIEPIIMVVMGVAIGFIVISIISPIYQATQSLR